MPLNSNKLRCGDSPNSVPAESPQVPAKCTPIETVWVSTDLKMWWPRDPSFIARDCQIDNRCFRRLDPEYFAWLRCRVLTVSAAVASGRVAADAFEELRSAFYAVQARALDTFGEPALREALGRIDPIGYRPPLPDPVVPANRQRRPAN